MTTLALPQPLPALIGLGVVHVIAVDECLPVGRIAIAATEEEPAQHLGEWFTFGTRSTWKLARRQSFDDEFYFGVPLSLGVVLLTATIEHCLPIVRTEVADKDQRAVHIVGDHVFGFKIYDTTTTGYNVRLSDCHDISDQLPYSTFTPGRWALVLSDVAPTTQPEATK